MLETIFSIRRLLDVEAVAQFPKRAHVPPIIAGHINRRLQNKYTSGQALACARADSRGWVSIRRNASMPIAPLPDMLVPIHP